MRGQPTSTGRGQCSRGRRQPPRIVRLLDDWRIGIPFTIALVAPIHLVGVFVLGVPWWQPLNPGIAVLIAWHYWTRSRKPRNDIAPDPLREAGIAQSRDQK